MGTNNAKHTVKWIIKGPNGQKYAYCPYRTVQNMDDKQNEQNNAGVLPRRNKPIYGFRHDQNMRKNQSQ